jgi:integrase
VLTIRPARPQELPALDGVPERRRTQQHDRVRLFVGPKGAVPRRRNFNRIWKAALKHAGIPDDLDLHLHELRHTGSTWSAQSGATLKDLMARIGHSSTRAAMIYQHASRERDDAIAAALDVLIVAAREQANS